MSKINDILTRVHSQVAETEKDDTTKIRLTEVRFNEISKCITELVSFLDNITTDDKVDQDKLSASLAADVQKFRNIVNHGFLYGLSKVIRFNKE